MSDINYRFSKKSQRNRRLSHAAIRPLTEMGKANGDGFSPVVQYHESRTQQQVRNSGGKPSVGAGICMPNTNHGDSCCVTVSAAIKSSATTLGKRTLSLFATGSGKRVSIDFHFLQTHTAHMVMSLQFPVGTKSVYQRRLTPQQDTTRMQLDSNELYRTGGGSTLRAGMVLQHKFTLLNHIAGGGMGEVWLAADSSRPENGQPSRVAVKFLHAPLRFNPEADRTFRKEFQRVWKLRSKNICELKELGHEPEIGSFIVMEYLEGETLRDTLARSPSGLPFDTAIKVLAAVASALDLAHAPPTNIIHCDVKPENIIYNPRTGSVHVIDFGIAAEISRFTRSAAVPLGTPAYMAPEQWNDPSPTRHSDIWSLGVLAAELLTGELPFNCPNVALATHDIQNSRPTPLQRHLQHLNPVFDIVFSRIPQHRFADCKSFLQALQSAHQRFRGSPVKPRAFLTINNNTLRPSLISLAIITAIIAALALPTSTIRLTEPTQSQSPPTTSPTSHIPQHEQAELSIRSVPPLRSQTAPPTTQALTAESTPSAAMKTKTETSEPVPGPESIDRKDANLIPGTAMKIDKRFRDYLETHPALLTADASAEIVYIDDTRQFMIIAVGSSSLRVRNPRTACELKALASLAAVRSRMDIRKTVQLDDLGAVSRITTSLEGATYGLPAVTEWISPDGQSITVLYGQIVDITDHSLKKGI